MLTGAFDARAPRPLSSARTMIRILIADDHAIVRAGLRQFIADHADMQVAAEVATGAEAIAAVRAQEFDVVLLDISMPDKNGIDTLKTIRHVRPELPVLMLSGYAEDQYAVNLLRAGAAGYLNKEAASSQLVGAIRTVVLGRKFVSPSLAQILADGVSGDADRPLHAELSQREFQIFCKLAAGAAVSKIADELNLSVKTVSTYRTRVLEKMAMKSNADLTYYAIKNGLIE
jgi:two-component system, NarL family, invasion response regulator UvrY